MYYSMLAMLVWLPLPWGSNTPWAIGLFCLWVFSVLAGWLCLALLGQAGTSPALRRSRPVTLILVVVQLWVCLQLLPLPIAVVEWLSPHAASIRLALDPHLRFAPLTLDRAATLLHCQLGFAYTALFCLVLLLANSATRVRLLARVILFSGLFQACYGSFMVLSGMEYSFFTPKETHLGRATGTFLNRNHLANYLTLCLAAGIGLLLATISQRKAVSLRDAARQWLAVLLSEKARLRLFLAIMVIGLVLTISRMGNTSFFLSLGIAGGIAVLAGRRVNRKLLLLFASLVLVDLLIVGEWFGFDKVVERLESTNLHQEERGQVNRQTLVLIGDFPLTGTGAGTFASSFTRYRSADIIYYYDYAHNDYLQFATELGIPATLLLIIACGLSLAAAIRAQFKRRNPLFQGMAFSATMAILAMAIHSTVEFNLQIPANAATFIVMLALAWISASMPGKERRRHHRR